MDKEETKEFLIKKKEIKSILKKRDNKNQNKDTVNKNEKNLKERFDNYGNKINSNKNYKISFDMTKTKIHNIQNWSKFNSTYSPRKKCCTGCLIF